MKSLEMKNCNMMITEKQQKYQLYDQVKMINMDILQVKRMLPSNQRQIVEQVKFEYSPLGKALDKQTEKQVGAIKSLDLPNNKYKLKVQQVIFSQNLVNDVIRDKLTKLICKILLKQVISVVNQKVGKFIILVNIEIYIKVIYHKNMLMMRKAIVLLK